MRTVVAFLGRELHAALLNRFILSFSAVALIAGIVPLFADVTADPTATAAYILLQASLYMIPLVSLLIATSSAQNEAEEQPLLMSQPIRRGSRVLGKFLALWLVIALAALLLVVPAAVAGARLGTLLFLCLHALGAGGIFAALGLAIGFSTADRVKAHMIALAAWLLFLVGGDLIALALAQTGVMQRLPDLWLALLMLNPLDALRISGLLSLDRIPFDIASAPPLGQWWLGNLGLWFVLLSAGWIALSLAWSLFRLEKQEF
jgi:ABC-2 type transport system permease protein/Cu-processing system permease protein